MRLKIAILSVLVLSGFSLQVSAQSPFLEGPVCGDDTSEFLVEEIGEVRESAMFNGDYGCTYSRTQCLYRGDDGDEFHEQGEYRNAKEIDEEAGRLKNDQEFCFKRTEDDFGAWWDQDYGDVNGDGFQDTCKVNNIYGKKGIRWFPTSYIDQHPESVAGGIDDDWNQYLEDNGHKDVAGDSEVQTGSPNKSIATVGFCGGDDGGEHLVTMECDTRYCNTDRTVQGVAEVPGSCIFDEQASKYDTNLPDPIEKDHRQLFEPGEQITITSVSGNPKIECFNGVWFSDWPVNFKRDNITVTLGDSRRAAVEIINVRNAETSFSVSIKDGDGDTPASSFSEFVETGGKSFQVSIPADSSKTFHINIRGAKKKLDDNELTVVADGVNSDQFGTDSLKIEVVNRTQKPGRKVARDVPGIQMIQILFLLMASGLVLFFRM
ncbi:MAG: hypothetical protein ABEJ56_02615 [Candidatus Nanohaloarchaea archaeon]